MNISFEIPELVAVGTILFLSATFLFFIFYGCDSHTDSKVTRIVIILLWAIWGFSEGYKGTIIQDIEKSSTRTIVSNMKETSIDGKIDGFLFLSGVIETTRYYLLREEIEPHLYKDFRVQGEIYIREDPKLSEKGKFILTNQCQTMLHSYSILGFEPIEPWKETKCAITKKEIVVPMGYVIKDLNI